MFRQGEQVTATKLRDVFMQMFRQINTIDHTQIKAITCGQIVGIESKSGFEYEPLSCCIDQFFVHPYQNDDEATDERSFVNRYVKDINLLRNK